jgi:hypothetical protein
VVQQLAEHRRFRASPNLPADWRLQFLRRTDCEVIAMEGQSVTTAVRQRLLS